MKVSKTIHSHTRVRARQANLLAHDFVKMEMFGQPEVNQLHAADLQNRWGLVCGCDMCEVCVYVVLSASVRVCICVCMCVRVRVGQGESGGWGG